MTAYDARDVRQWSGTGYHAAQALEHAGAQVRYLGPLDVPVESLGLRARGYMYGRLPRNRLGTYSPTCEPFVLRLLPKYGTDFLASK